MITLRAILDDNHTAQFMNMQHKPHRVTRVQAKGLDVDENINHVTSVFMPMVTGGLDGVAAIRAGVLQMAQLPDKTVRFRPLFGAN